jgi:NAD(P)-dependent dehydrogenase (short-subunit alcohol dehydrogenase family)
MSLGVHIASYAREKGENVWTAGVSGEEISLNVESRVSITEALQVVKPSSIICTVGVNMKDADDPTGYYQMAVNYHGVMALLREWLDHYADDGQFVAISSNSAHVARTDSAGYCASKAALSMGIRCVARKEAAARGLVYAWEFGLLAGTPMTAAVQTRLGPGMRLTRMPGHPNGQNVVGAARAVVDMYRGGTAALNGCTLRLDGGDQ